MKTCTKCGVEKPHTEYNVNTTSRNTVYLYTYCTVCLNKQTKLSRHSLWKRHPEKHEKYKADQKKRMDKRPKHEKVEYDKLRYSKNRESIKAKAKQWRKENWEHWRMVRFTKHYNISKEYYWELRKIENCQCCGDHKSKFKKGLFIDHNHDTGKVRGLICCHCNSVAGFSRDNKERLKLVGQYLLQA